MTSYSKQKEKNNIGEILPRLLEDYDKFKGIIEVPPEIKGFIISDIFVLRLKVNFRVSMEQHPQIC